MNAPRYAVYMMVDEPHGNKSTYGYSTAGWVAAPAAGRVIARIAPMLGDAAGHPGRAGDQPGTVYPAGARPPGRRCARGPWRPRAAAEALPTPLRREAGADGAGDALPPARPMTRDPRHEAACAGRRWPAPPWCPRPCGAPRLRLADIMRQSPSWPVPPPASWRMRRPGDRRHHRRQPARGAGYLFAALPGSRGPTAARSSPMRCRAAPWRCSRPSGTAGRPACRRARCWRTPSRAAASPRLPPDWPGDSPGRGRGHRHQRQDQHGGVPAPDLVCMRPAAASLARWA